MLLKTMQVDYNYTGDEQAQGLAKLVEAATVYDATGPACLGLGAFQVTVYIRFTVRGEVSWLVLR